MRLNIRRAVIGVLVLLVAGACTVPDAAGAKSGREPDPSGRGGGGPARLAGGAPSGLEAHNNALRGDGQTIVRSEDGVVRGTGGDARGRVFERSESVEGRERIFDARDFGESIEGRDEGMVATLSDGRRALNIFDVIRLMALDSWTGVTFDRRTAQEESGDVGAGGLSRETVQTDAVRDRPAREDRVTGSADTRGAGTEQASRSSAPTTTR